MRLDSLLLDRIFQPVSDRVADVITCFGLARLSLAVAVALQLIVLTADFLSVAAPVEFMATVGVTLLALFGALQAWSLITRTERQACSGGPNARRITLRWQRLAWLAVTVWALSTAMPEGGAAGLGLCGACFAWLGLMYFVSCTPATPSRSFGALRPPKTVICVRSQPGTLDFSGLLAW